MPVPDTSECIALLRKHQVPSHIVGHSVMVARVSVSLGCILNRINSDQGGGNIDIRLVEAAGLLHDIAKMECINQLCEHAQRGAEILNACGCPEVAHLVRQHVALDRPVAEYREVDEAMVLNYADKRVMHTEFVSLERRFEDLIERYGTTAERKRRIELMYQETKFMENMIFRIADISPADLEPAPLHDTRCEFILEHAGSGSAA